MILPGFLRPSRLRRMDGADLQAGFAMMIAMLLILVIAGMGLLVAGFVLSESTPTQTARKTVATVNAAEAGFEVSLHQMRSATDSNGNGILAKLPCTATSSALGTLLTGAVGPKSGAANNQSLTYNVYVRYYTTDPTTMGTSDLNTTAIGCAGGAPAVVPSYAYLQSIGVGVGGASAQGAQGNRSLHTTYRFRTSTLNIAGGRININTTTLCLDAGAAPAVGSPVSVTTCQNRGVLASQSSWSYRTDLTLYLTTSQSPELCVTAGTTMGTAATAQLTLQGCATDGEATTYPYLPSPSLQQRQEWSFDDNGKFEGADVGGDLDSYCMSTSDYAHPTAGAALYEQAGTCTSGFDTMTWNPDPQVGAGAAGDDTQQLVNYYDFGRCLDVTDQNVASTWLIDYPCKQAPNPGKIAWNQRWIYTTTTATIPTTTVSTTSSGNTYCLQAPATISTVPSVNVVTVQRCNAATATQKWKKQGVAPGDFTSSYTIVSNLGACLSTAAGRGDTYHQQFSTIVVEACDGSLKQKWNAPANFIDSRFKGTGEDAGGKVGP
jgi:Tfp pilus assembly protein PilX